MHHAKPDNNLVALPEPGQRRRQPGSQQLRAREQRKQRLQAAHLGAMLAEMEQEAGPIPDEIMEQARHDLRRWADD